MKKNNLYYLIISLPLAFICFTYCNGQEKNSIRHEIVSTTNEQTKLPKVKNTFTAASVGCALQDKEGNIWLGTNGEGLFRYDGKTFTNFSEKDGLDNHIIYALLQDAKGNIWIGTKTGLCKYDGKTFSVISINTSNAAFLNLNNGSSSQNGVWSMMQDKSGKIWFGTDNGVFCFDGTKFSNFLTNEIINTDNLHLKTILSFLEDKHGNMWFGSCIGEGLIRYDGKILSRISPKGYARTQYITEDKNCNIWFSSIGKGMCRYDGKSINTNFFKEKDTHDLLYLIWKDKAENIWFCETFNDRALCYYDGNSVINFSKKNVLPNKKMYPILEDKIGNIWFSAEGMRLYKWDGKTFSDLSEK